jgi:hypothetical protein
MKTLLTLIVLAGLLTGAVLLALKGWSMGGDDVGLSTHGRVALAIGIGGTLALGCGLMFLVFYSSRRGFDAAADDWRRRMAGGDRSDG